MISRLVEASASEGTMASVVRRPTICFYADDFTGASDALAQFIRFGLTGILLFSLPPAAELARIARNVDVLGIAGLSRTLDGDELESELTSVFEAFVKLEPQFVQYKASSTLDSSPSIGSIGTAIDVALTVFGEMPVPVLVAQPELGRFTVFANHFAASPGGVSRLDRHAPAAEHVITPITEADVRILLEQQTARDISSVGLFVVSQGNGTLARAWDEIPDGQVAVFDSLDSDDVRNVGQLLFQRAREGVNFVVGSGGLSFALGSAFGKMQPLAALEHPGEADSFLAVSGSASTHTSDQINFVVGLPNWSEVLFNHRLMDQHDYRTATLRRVLVLLAAGQAVVVHPASCTKDGVRTHSDGIGAFLGWLVDQCLHHVPLSRLLVAGGDTAGRVLRQLDFAGAKVIGRDFAPGVSLLNLVRFEDETSLPALLKGGQAGALTFFEDARLGVVRAGVPSRSSFASGQAEQLED